MRCPFCDQFVHDYFAVANHILLEHKQLLSFVYGCDGFFTCWCGSTFTYTRDYAMHLCNQGLGNDGLEAHAALALPRLLNVEDD
jgi:uncharacterized C2H2 Zn-finger protein